MNKPAFIIVLVIQILQTCFVVYSTVVYKGVHDTASFIVLPIAIIYGSHKILFKNNLMNHNKIRFAGMMVLTISIPIMLFMTQPKYIYEEGKLLIIEKYNEYQNFEFTKYKRTMTTVPITENRSGFLIRNKGYYYSIIIDSDYIYFLVDPVSGNVFKIDKWYWPEDM